MRCPGVTAVDRCGPPSDGPGRAQEPTERVKPAGLVYHAVRAETETRLGVVGTGRPPMTRPTSSPRRRTSSSSGRGGHPDDAIDDLA